MWQCNSSVKMTIHFDLNSLHLYTGIMNINVNQINTYKRCCCKVTDYRNIRQLKRAIFTAARMEHSLLPDSREHQKSQLNVTSNLPLDGALNINKMNRRITVIKEL